jgi:hypothetical protein
LLILVPILLLSLNYRIRLLQLQMSIFVAITPVRNYSSLYTRNYHLIKQDIRSGFTFLCLCRS